MTSIAGHDAPLPTLTDEVPVDDHSCRRSLRRYSCCMRGRIRGRMRGRIAIAFAAPVTASAQDVGLPVGAAARSDTLRTPDGKTVNPAEAAILDVMHRFDMAIRNHDASALKDLFYKQDIAWRLSLSTVQVEKYKKTSRRSSR